MLLEGFNHKVWTHQLGAHEFKATQLRYKRQGYLLTHPVSGQEVVLSVRRRVTVAGKSKYILRK